MIDSTSLTFSLRNFIALLFLKTQATLANSRCFFCTSFMKVDNKRICYCFPAICFAAQGAKVIIATVAGLFAVDMPIFSNVNEHLKLIYTMIDY
jgi:hypothetical protein